MRPPENWDQIENCRNRTQTHQKFMKTPWIQLQISSNIYCETFFEDKMISDRILEDPTVPHTQPMAPGETWMQCWDTSLPWQESLGLSFFSPQSQSNSPCTASTFMAQGWGHNKQESRIATKSTRGNLISVLFAVLQWWLHNLSI